MKKNLFFWMAAIVMLVMSSCQQEADLATEGTEATVSFHIGTPKIATRAYSDGATATVLQYAVYDENGQELTDLTVTDGEIHGSTTVNLQLTTGNTYSVIFWAAAQDAPYTVDFANKTMKVDYDGVLSNAENLDAFFKCDTFTVTGNQTEIIELRRPFAQLNIGTNDYVASEKAGYMPTKSFVKVTKIYDSLNLETGEVYNPVEVTYDYADIDTTEFFPVTGYNYLAMNYLLVAKDQEVIDVEFGYTETDENAAKTRKVGSVPVQRNYRTNIYGQLLTSAVVINVEIKPAYEEPALEADELFLAAAIGGKVTLKNDVELTSPLIIQSNVIIDLAGFSIKGGKAYVDGLTGTDIAVITVDNGASLTIEGEGSIEGGEYGIYAKNGNVIVKGGDIKATSSAIQVNVGNANIEGGNFSNTDADKRYLINCIDANWKNGKAKVSISGGRFSEFNPGNNAAEGAGTNFLAEECSVVEDGNWYVVASIKTVDNVTDFEEAVENSTASKVVATEDIELTSALNIDNRGSLVIDMNGNTLSRLGYVGNIKNNSQVIVENGEFLGGFQTAYEGAKLTFNSGTIKVTDTNTSGRYCFSVVGGAEVEINGGESSFATLTLKRAYIYAENSTVYVKGGVFGKASTRSGYTEGILTKGTGTVIISGGTFGFNPTPWLADGFIANYDSTTETWTVE